MALLYAADVTLSNLERALLSPERVPGGSSMLPRGGGEGAAKRGEGGGAAKRGEGGGGLQRGAKGGVGRWRDRRGHGCSV